MRHNLVKNRIEWLAELCTHTHTLYAMLYAIFIVWQFLVAPYGKTMGAATTTWNVNGTPQKRSFVCIMRHRTVPNRSHRCRCYRRTSALYNILSPSWPILADGWHTKSTFCNLSILTHIHIFNGLSCENCPGPGIFGIRPSHLHEKPNDW